MQHCFGGRLAQARCEIKMPARNYRQSLIAPLAAILSIVFFANHGSAETRIALVIGNSTYQNVPMLPNPISDAKAMSQLLSRLDFQVTEVSNASYDKMRRFIQAFARASAAADVAALYYAGHGIEIDGQNYLVPIDARLQSDRDVEFEAVTLQLVMGAMGNAKRLSLIILDACRDNPFGRKMISRGATRSIGRGLGRVEPVGDTLVAYAAKAGSVAEDGAGEHSPYASALLRHLDEPGVEIAYAFRRIRDSVLATTGGRQEPFVYGSLGSEQFYLKPPTSAPGSDARSSNAPVDIEAVNRNADVMFWSAIEKSGRWQDFAAYLDAFPKGIFAALAKQRVASLKDGEKRNKASPGRITKNPPASQSPKIETGRNTPETAHPKLEEQRSALSAKINELKDQGPFESCDFRVNRWNDPVSHDLCLDREAKIKELEKEIRGLTSGR
jgi:hypothetical protein